MELVGRKREQEILNRFLDSDEPEFLAVYGRRRVGKTFLVREFFRNKGLFLEVAGQRDGSLKAQLTNCLDSINEAFRPALPLKPPESWAQAFDMLTTLMATEPPGKKKIIFLDELPWMAGRRSGVMEALEYAWNRRWSQIPDLKLIVCGSAASWMLERLVHGKGGLYNRITHRILLKPFSLSDARAYLRHRGFSLQDEQVLDLYMVFGGIPYYLRQLRADRSVAQNINDLCFRQEGFLFDEFEPLLRSLFEHSEVHERIVRAIAGRRHGTSRDELLDVAEMSSGGTLARRLDELEASCFIERFTPIDKKRKDFYLKIVDEFTLFYLNWIEPMKRGKASGGSRNHWLTASRTPAYHAWSGYAFEAVCLKHIDQIIHALGLDAIVHRVGSWQFRPTKGSGRSGSQVDLLIDRTDGAITLCEMKHQGQPYAIDKSTAKDLARKIRVFQEQTATTRQVFLALVTSSGLKRNIWSEELVDQEVTLPDLFSH